MSDDDVVVEWHGWVGDDVRDVVGVHQHAWRDGLGFVAVGVVGEVAAGVSFSHAYTRVGEALT